MLEIYLFLLIFSFYCWLLYTSNKDTVGKLEKRSLPPVITIAASIVDRQPNRLTLTTSLLPVTADRNSNARQTIAITLLDTEKLQDLNEKKNYGAAQQQQMFDKNIILEKSRSAIVATKVLAVGLLLENLSVLGVCKTLNILREVEFMAQQSVLGQAMELDWVATNVSHLCEGDYFKMCVKKTCWYSLITPYRIGLMIANPAASADDLVEPLAGLTRFGMILLIAFKIQDLNSFLRLLQQRMGEQGCLSAIAQV